MRELEREREIEFVRNRGKEKERDSERNRNKNSFLNRAAHCMLRAMFGVMKTNRHSGQHQSGHQGVNYKVGRSPSYPCDDDYDGGDSEPEWKCRRVRIVKILYNRCIIIIGK